MPHSLVGAWRLLSYESISATGETTLPLGPNPIGRIEYRPDGRMFALLVAAGRPSIGWSAFGDATVEEKAAAYDSAVAYYGTYEVEGDLVIHHVEASTLPAFTGNDVERYFRIDAGRLVLTFVFATPGPQAGQTLVWERADT